MAEIYVSQETAPRLFTVAGANACVPRLTVLFDQIQGELTRVRELASALSEAGYPLEEDEPVQPDPRAPVEIRAKQTEVSDLMEQIAEALGEVVELGAEVKSADGLVDFRSRRRGEVIYLCWRLGETQITHWHDLTTGFAGRVRIEDADEFEGDLLQ